MEKILTLFRKIAKEFAAVDDSGVTIWIGIAMSLVSKKNFGQSYDFAVSLMTAHLMKMNGEGNQGLEVLTDIYRIASYSEGETSVSYASPPAGDELDYGLTVYGRQFLTLRKKMIIPILCRGQGTR